MWAAATLALVSGLLWARNDAVASASGSARTRYDPLFDGAPCNIDVFGSPEALSVSAFVSKYRNRKPVIIRGATPATAAFVRKTHPLALLDELANTSVVLSSGNAVSHGKKTVTFREYYEEHMVPVRLGMRADKVWYKFGDHNSEELDTWGPLLAEYDAAAIPLILEREETALSFGLGSHGSGVPFHIHGAVFADLLHGRKRWFLYPPGEAPPFDGNTTTLSWLHATYPMLPRDRRPHECVCEPGDLIYLPSMWWHATLNAADTVFLSAFVNDPDDF